MRPKWNLLLLGLLIVVLILIGLFADRFTLYLTSRVMILSIFALGYNLLLGGTGLLSPGHGAFYAAGAYGLGLFSLHVTPHPLAETVLVSLIGGIQTFSGPLVGSAIYIILHEIIERFTQNWMLWVAIILLLIIMGFRGGVVGGLSRISDKLFMHWGTADGLFKKKEIKRKYMGVPILVIENLNKTFGRVRAVCNINLSLDEGVLTSVIGPNGAGKSTLINMLSGALPVDSGRILFQDTDITRWPIHRRVRLGLCRSFQVVNVFPELTVFDNIQIPVLTMLNRSRKVLRSIFKEKRAQMEVNGILDLIGLTFEAQTPARALSHGDQRLLEVGIALAARPSLLFLDEPTAGMNPVERVKILDSIRRLSAIGKTTFVIVEHDMDVVFSLSQRVIVLHRGAVIGDGSTEDVQANPYVREVYLGQEVAS